MLSGRGLCVGQITRPEESAVCLSMIMKPREWEGPGPIGAVQRHEKILLRQKYPFSFHCPTSKY
jgi:hypothetical protein